MRPLSKHELPWTAYRIETILESWRHEQLLKLYIFQRKPSCSEWKMCLHSNLSWTHKKFFFLKILAPSSIVPPFILTIQVTIDHNNGPIIMDHNIQMILPFAYFVQVHRQVISPQHACSHLAARPEVWIAKRNENKGKSKDWTGGKMTECLLSRSISEGI